MPTLEPVLLGASFSWRGWGSWALGLERAQRMAEVQTRAHAYGLPPITWPAGWPGNGLAAMRAATWAKREGRVEAFARSVVRVQFIHGADITDGEVLAACAQDAGLDPDSMREAISAQEIKAALRQATQQAWDAGVTGIPSLRAAETIWYGEDQLEQAAAQLRG